MLVLPRQEYIDGNIVPRFILTKTLGTLAEQSIKMIFNRLLRLEDLTVLKKNLRY